MGKTNRASRFSTTGQADDERKEKYPSSHYPSSGDGGDLTSEGSRGQKTSGESRSTPAMDEDCDLLDEIVLSVPQQAYKNRTKNAPYSANQKAGRQEFFCPYDRECAQLHSKEELSSHLQIYHFRCRSCQQTLSQLELETHLQDFDHDAWDLSPLNPHKVQRIPLDRDQLRFPNQGYGLTTEKACKLKEHQAIEILQIREQVDETVLQFVVEGSNDAQWIYLQHCYEVKGLFVRIASTARVGVDEIEQLHIMLPWDFTSEVELGECHIIPADDNNALQVFIGLIERAWRETDGVARMLCFACKAFIRYNQTMLDFA